MGLPTFAIAGLAASVLVAVSLPAQASPYTAEYVFGDSLSDNGNLDEAFSVSGKYPTTGFPNPPSFHGSFTNGPTAVVDLAASYGLTLNPSLWLTAFKDPANLFGGPAFVPGTNYAVAGATSVAQAVGGPAAINLPQQLGAYNLVSGGKADPNALYVVMIGGNDVRNAAIQGTGAAAITAGVTTEVTAVKTLTAEGVKNILVVNVPNVGVIPEFNTPGQDGFGFASTATLLSQQYNSALASALNGLAGVSLFDLYAFNTGVLANAAAEGFTDTVDPCYVATPYSAATTAACGPNAQNIGSFLYWDSIHPTAKVQALWAGAFAATLSQPVPEPGSIALVGAGLLGLAGWRRRAA